MSRLANGDHLHALFSIDRDTDKDVKATWGVLETMGLKTLASDSDVSILRYLASAVSIRAAQIVGACKRLNVLYTYCIQRAYQCYGIGY